MAHDLETPLRCTAAFEAHSEAIVRRHSPNHANRLSAVASYMPLTTAWEWSLPLGSGHTTRTYDSLTYGKMIESSIAYMMALAMEEQPDTIGIFGVDMAEGEEYGYQRPNMAYLIGKAEGLGIEVVLHPASSLLKSEWTGGCYGHPDNVDDMEIRLGSRMAAHVSDEAMEAAAV